MLTIDLRGRAAVITGGSSGIGLACAALFLRAGAQVAICGRDAERLRQAQVRLRAEHPQAELLAQPCNVLDKAQVASFAGAVAQRFGAAAMLINNAGQGRVANFAQTSDEAWQEELQLKFFSLIHPIRAFLPQLESCADAAIVCVNSLLALQPEPHMVATSAARAGAQNLVRSLAREFAPKGIRVNSVLLGLVDSDQWRRRFDARETGEERDQDWAAWSAALAARKGIELGRLGRPEEAAAAIFHLATPASSYTTGSHLDVSGGLAHHI